MVRRALSLALHTKCFTLLGTRSFHMSLQKLVWGLGFELLALLAESSRNQQLICTASDETTRRIGGPD